ncbi:hypothetical protein KC363_g135 [Hortaea werneckii]|nr:hypothetical protein KC363_g135 [Hortaea werneckii]
MEVRYVRTFLELSFVVKPIDLLSTSVCNMGQIPDTGDLALATGRQELESTLVLAPLIASLDRLPVHSLVEKVRHRDSRFSYDATAARKGLLDASCAALRDSQRHVSSASKPAISHVRAGWEGATCVFKPGGWELPSVRVGKPWMDMLADTGSS